MLSYLMTNYANIQPVYKIIESNFHKSYATHDSVRHLDRPPATPLDVLKIAKKKWCDGKPVGKRMSRAAATHPRDREDQGDSRFDKDRIDG